jgi:hypothetical protein
MKVKVWVLLVQPGVEALQVQMKVGVLMVQLRDEALQVKVGVLEELIQGH